MRVKALPQTDDVRAFSGAYFPFRGMYVQRNILSEEGVICVALQPPAGVWGQSPHIILRGTVYGQFRKIQYVGAGAFRP